MRTSKLISSFFQAGRSHQQRTGKLPERLRATSEAEVEVQASDWDQGPEDDQESRQEDGEEAERWHSGFSSATAENLAAENPLT